MYIGQRGGKKIIKRLEKFKNIYYRRARGPHNFTFIFNDQKILS